MFAFIGLMGKCVEAQKELLCVFVDLDKAGDRVPGEGLWYWTGEVRSGGNMY